MAVPRVEARRKPTAPQPQPKGLIGALIGGAVSLIDKAKDRNAQRRANEANRPASQVAQWEAAGINPIFGISQGQYVPVQATSIGDTYATVGNRIGELLDYQFEEKREQTRLEQENEALAKKIEELARPVSPGYIKRYGPILQLPRQGGRDAVRQSLFGDDDRHGPDLERGGDHSDSVDQTRLQRLAHGRDIEIAPATNGPGLTVIDNVLTGPFVVPGADGEP